jgi:hypothetical protein
MPSDGLKIIVGKARIWSPSRFKTARGGSAFSVSGFEVIKTAFDFVRLSKPRRPAQESFVAQRSFRNG